MFANQDAERSMLLVMRFCECGPGVKGVSESATRTSGCAAKT